MMTAHLYGRSRNCHYVAARYNIKQLTMARYTGEGSQTHVTLSHYHTTKLPNYQTTKLPNYRTTTLPHIVFLRINRQVRKDDAKDLWDARVEGQANELNYNTW